MKNTQLLLLTPDSLEPGTCQVFITLPHPRTFQPTYYLITPFNVYEVSHISSGSGSGSAVQRSMMISKQNQIISQTKLNILTPIDARFLVLSLLFDESSCSSGQVRKFQTLEDWLLPFHQEEENSLLPLELAIQMLSDHQKVSEETTVYRGNLTKLNDFLTQRIDRISREKVFQQTSNTLGRSFERRYQPDSITADQLRRQIAQEVVLAYVSPSLASLFLSSTSS